MRSLPPAVASLLVIAIGSLIPNHPDGTFKIANVPPGKYTIQVAHRKAGKATQEVEVKDSGGKADFTLEAK